MPNTPSEDNLTVIKRYQNRKLYDTRHSSYVTLDDIAQMVKEGEEVKIIDNRTKEDITSITFAQIIFEEEKKKKQVLPLSAFKKIIQGGEQLFGLVTHGVSQAKEEAEKAIERIRDEIANPELPRKVDQKIRSTLESLAHMTNLQNEVKRLRDTVSKLEGRLLNHKSDHSES